MDNPVFMMLAIVVLFAVVIGWTRYVKGKSVKRRKGRSESSPDEES
ncbi:MAG: hypothetical protein AAFP70_01890 [Calditrichota bacterium]